MPSKPVSDHLFEITCWCKPKSVPDDVDEWDILVWMSKVSPPGRVDGVFRPGKPLTPCPECGRTDQVSRISSGWHRG